MKASGGYRHEVVPGRDVAPVGIIVFPGGEGAVGVEGQVLMFFSGYGYEIIFNILIYLFTGQFQYRCKCLSRAFNPSSFGNSSP